MPGMTYATVYAMVGIGLLLTRSEAAYLQTGSMGPVYLLRGPSWFVVEGHMRFAFFRRRGVARGVRLIC
jgi:hypothetical protein